MKHFIYKWDPSFINEDIYVVSFGTNGIPYQVADTTCSELSSQRWSQTTPRGASQELDLLQLLATRTVLEHPSLAYFLSNTCTSGEGCGQIFECIAFTPFVSALVYCVYCDYCVYRVCVVCVLCVLLCVLLCVCVFCCVYV